MPKRSKEMIVRGGFRRPFLQFVLRERDFLLILVVGFSLAGLFYDVHSIAMWLGFIFAGYAAIANDSIQTLGTFIVSNSKRPWWQLWLFVALILIAVLVAGWFINNGDVTWKKLYNPASYPDLPQHSQYPQPSSFSFIQLAAPLVLLILTRMRMPVSTTFLLLSCFSSNSKGITDVLGSSLSGYAISFTFSLLIWILGYSIIRTFFKQRKSASFWVPLQWSISGVLWGVWLMQDAANIAVYLPRQIDALELTAVVGLLVLGLAILMRQRGDKIQDIVNEKSRIEDIRAATLIDFSYAGMLIYKMFASPVPLSTTWVFLGIIGGREIAISIMRKKAGIAHKRKAVLMIIKDISYAVFGLLVSLAMAVAVNDSLRREVQGMLSF
jgi:hypothetical protein